MRSVPPAVAGVPVAHACHVDLMIHPLTQVVLIPLPLFLNRCNLRNLRISLVPSPLNDQPHRQLAHKDLRMKPLAP